MRAPHGPSNSAKNRRARVSTRWWDGRRHAARRAPRCVRASGLEPRQVGASETRVTGLRGVDCQARNFAKQRRLHAPCLDSERGRKMKAAHVEVVANADDRIRALCDADDAVSNSRQLNHTFDFACHVFEHLAARGADYARASAIVYADATTMSTTSQGCVVSSNALQASLVRVVRTSQHDLRSSGSSARTSTPRIVRSTRSVKLLMRVRTQLAFRVQLYAKSKDSQLALGELA